MSSISIQVVGPMDHEPKVPFADDVQAKWDSFTNLKDKSSVIQFDPLIKSGIVRFEVLDGRNLSEVGIAKMDAHYKRNEDPYSGLNYIFVAGWKPTGCLSHLGDSVYTDSKYSDGDVVALELNMDSDPRTLSLFVNGKMQNDFITHVPDAVRFWAHISKIGDSFKVLKFERLPNPTGVHCEESREWKYGEDWIKK
ncbi:MAG: hypothetical protein EZS28_017155 [Streblomastix strix]|uniref:SPRY domain-containing protein n=1 Tax=Streblomastix strix TaxID=222440 RepID=A0A5J4VYJ2_9EUKA|nr:MAG: hypothetical protein EZS28_017155 [Streblomastix strix]